MQEPPRPFPITVGLEPIQARSSRHSNIVIPAAVYRPGGYGANHLLMLLGHYGEIPCDSEVWEYLGVLPKAAQKEVERFAAKRYGRWGRLAHLAYKFARVFRKRNYVDIVDRKRRLGSCRRCRPATGTKTRSPSRIGDPRRAFEARSRPSSGDSCGLPWHCRSVGTCSTGIRRSHRVEVLTARCQEG